MPEIVIGEAPGVRITERIRHQGFFFGHRDTDLEQRWLPEVAALDPATLDWPEGAVVLRVLHHVTRVRHVWGEALPATDETVASAQVYARADAVLATGPGELEALGSRLRDPAAAARTLRGSGRGGIIVDPRSGGWAKLRAGERLAPA
ncbi:MAG: hypothetical protein U5K43_03570 [Halofilum sp. (in: g-proteobacteria)]|nr:hypothetical protein [Halofilum sp. (in: g-proteobacteria)]